MDAIKMVLNGTLRPNLSDTRGEDYWGPEFNLLEMPLETFIPHYEIKFTVPPFSYRLKYYIKLIDAAAIKELNELFHKYHNASDAIIAYGLMRLRRTTDSRIQEIHNIIVREGYDMESLSAPGVNYRNDSQRKEATYIYHYLLQALIKVYLEFQYHYGNKIDESKKRSYEDFYLLKMGIPAPVENRLIEVVANPRTKLAEKPADNLFSGKKGFWFANEAREITGTLTINLWIELERGKFIKAGTTLDEFKACFAEKQVKKKVVWIAGKSLLSYFIKQLYKTGIVCDEGSKWVAAANCFTDEQGSKYDPKALKDEKKPKLRCKEIDGIIAKALDSTKQ